MSDRLPYPVNLYIAEMQDLSGILRVFEHAVQSGAAEAYTPVQLAAWVAGVYDRDKWERRIKMQYFLVAEYRGTVVGFASLEGSDYVDLLFVSPDFARHGIASTLYHSLEAEALQRGAARLWADVSITARPFFENQGFTVVQKNTRELRGVEIENFRMEKKLA